ncbi:MAG: GNAT family N-acetyltransferase [Terracidiphilus sp.]
MLCSDLSLSRRLERAEGFACVQFAAARGRLFPPSGAEWMECAGTYAAFDGVDSPITQTFSLGLLEELTPSTLDTLEKFFFDRGADVHHEVSPFAGVAAVGLLCARGYRPLELTNVLYQPIPRSAGVPAARSNSAITVRAISPEEAPLWTSIGARGWSHEHPELHQFLLDAGAISANREGSICFIAEVNGTPGAAGIVCIHQGVALLGGAATVPELRRLGLQGALLQYRLNYALDRGCDVAMIATEPGSGSQRNAEREGFRIAYTRTKWRLARPV